MVKGQTDRFTVSRKLVLDPPPPQIPRRILINDTFSTPSTSKNLARSSSYPNASDIIGIYVRHRATVASTPDDVDSAIVPGTSSYEI